MWIIYAISAAVMWGLTYSLDEKVLHSKISLLTLLAMQMVVGSIFFTVLAYHSRLKADLHLLVSRHGLAWLFVATIFVTLISNLLITLSIQAKNATIAGLFEITYPLFTVLFTWLLFKESHINTGVTIGATLILIGSGIIMKFTT